ncbi:MAG: hypothetical protein ACI9UO_002763, partial [Nitrospinales bacterium]
PSPDLAIISGLSESFFDIAPGIFLLQEKRNNIESMHTQNGRTPLRLLPEPKPMT